MVAALLLLVVAAALHAVLWPAFQSLRWHTEEQYRAVWQAAHCRADGALHTQQVGVDMWGFRKFWMGRWLGSHRYSVM